jgi:hypothetical protein
MRSVRSVFREPAHVWQPEMLIAGVLAATLMLGMLDRFSAPAASIDPTCVSTPANRAEVLCAVRSNQNWTLPGFQH